MSLQSVTNARYTLTVTNQPNGGGDTVWSQTIEADPFGDGAGSIAYVGTCDADSGADNSVELVLDALYEGSAVEILPATYQNPTPLILNVPCVENADVPGSL